MSQLPLQNLHQQLVDLRGQAKTWLAKGYAEGFVPTFGICDHLTLTPSDQDPEFRSGFGLKPRADLAPKIRRET